MTVPIVTMEMRTDKESVPSDRAPPPALLLEEEGPGHRTDLCPVGGSEARPAARGHLAGVGMDVRWKMVAVGDSQCGKSALLNVFAKDRFPEVREPCSRPRPPAPVPRPPAPVPRPPAPVPRLASPGCGAKK